MGQTSSSSASRRMLSASRPSCSITPSAAWTIRSRDSRPDLVSAARGICVQCSVRRTHRREAWMAEHVAGIPEAGARTLEVRSRLSPPVVRLLPRLAIAGQVIFIAAWIVAGALQSGYSHIHAGISVLGARDAAHPWIVNTGFVVLGLSILALAPCVLAVLPRRSATRFAAAMFVVAGLTIALVAAFPVDCDLGTGACKARFDAGLLSWRTDVHLWLVLVFDLAFLATPFALARALWPRPVAAASLASGLFRVGLTLATIGATSGAGAPDGLVQRIGLASAPIWVVIVAVGVLYTLATRHDAGVLIPVRPRHFFGRAWAGRGEVTLYPRFLWRRFPLRIDFRREARWLNDEALVFTDTTTFATGFSVVRPMFCTIEGGTRVRVVAEDMPGGAELNLTEGGYRVRPYRFSYPLGPVRFTFTCHDRV